VGPVGHTHGVAAAPHPGYPHRPVAEPFYSFFGGEHRHGGAVGHLAAVEYGKRSRHHRRGTDFGNGQLAGTLGIGVVKGVPVVLDGHFRHLFHCGAEFEHVAPHHHGVIARVEPPDGKVEVGVRSQGDELVPLPGVDPAHGLEPHGETDLHSSRGHRFPRGLEAEAAGGASPLDAPGRLRAESQVILDHGARLELTGKMIREVGAYRAVDHLTVESGKVVQGVIKRLLHHESEILLRMCLGKPRNASGDHVDWTHLFSSGKVI